jgi:hypothetical protein
MGESAAVPSIHVKVNAFNIRALGCRWKAVGISKASSAFRLRRRGEGQPGNSLKDLDRCGASCLRSSHDSVPGLAPFVFDSWSADIAFPGSSFSARVSIFSESMVASSGKFREYFPVLLAPLPSGSSDFFWSFRIGILYLPREKL